MLESMIDINVEKRLETISQCHMLGSGFARLGHGHFNRSSQETALEISESDVGIELEVAELQATELSSAVLSLLLLT